MTSCYRQYYIQQASAMQHAAVACWRALSARQRRPAVPPQAARPSRRPARPAQRLRLVHPQHRGRWSVSSGARFFVAPLATSPSETRLQAPARPGPSARSSAQRRRSTASQRHTVRPHRAAGRRRPVLLTCRRGGRTDAVCVAVSHWCTRDRPDGSSAGAYSRLGHRWCDDAFGVLALFCLPFTRCKRG